MRLKLKTYFDDTLLLAIFSLEEFVLHDDIALKLVSVRGNYNFTTEFQFAVELITRKC